MCRDGSPKALLIGFSAAASLLAGSAKAQELASAVSTANVSEVVVTASRWQAKPMVQPKQDFTGTRLPSSATLQLFKNDAMDVSIYVDKQRAMIPLRNGAGIGYDFKNKIAGFTLKKRF